MTNKKSTSKPKPIPRPTPKKEISSANPPAFVFPKPPEKPPKK